MEELEGIKEVEGELNAVVKEYLHMLDYSKSIQTFESEVDSSGKVILLESLPPPQDDQQRKIQDAMQQSFNQGNTQAFFRLWLQHIPDETQQDKNCQRLEFNLHLYFAVYPIINDMGHENQHKIDKAMKLFKTFLESRGASLSQTTEFVAFYALPFVPNPKNHPSFKILFEESWSEELRQKVENFLSTVLYSAPLPYLYKLYTGAMGRSRVEKQEYLSQIQALQQQISVHEYRATTYFKRYTKIQADYHNLIGIAAELVDSLENAVRGRMVTPEYLQSICERLFSNAQNPMQSVDLLRPGTAASLLRASINNLNLGVSIGADVPYLPSLNYDKVKKDLASLPTRKKALLLQALRWRMTNSEPGEQRDAVVSAFVANDILGCQTDAQHRVTLIGLLNAKEEILRQYVARFINTLASFTTGRAYITHCEHLIKEMYAVLVKEKKGSPTSENLLGAMQKLSLRRQVQSVMIDSGLIEWLFRNLEEPDMMSEYTLEYSVALLMNLCLRSSGKRQCLEKVEDKLKLLTNLLGHENHEIRPYINGTLYSILALPTIRKRSISMGLEEVLRCFIEEDQPDMNRQIQFIIKQMNSMDATTVDDPQSDNEDDDDDDEEGDADDPEVDKEETMFAKSGEMAGEQLLSEHYLGVLSKVSSSLDTKNKRKLSQDGPLTRPITPRGQQQKLNSIQETSSTREQSTISEERPKSQGRPKTQERPTSQDRPRTQSSKAGRKQSGNSRELTLEMHPSRQAGSGRTRLEDNKAKGFSSHPKIPRTPESGDELPSISRPGSANPPVPTQSVSPPLPRASLSRGQASARESPLNSRSKSRK